MTDKMNNNAVDAPSKNRLSRPKQLIRTKNGNSSGIFSVFSGRSGMLALMATLAMLANGPATAQSVTGDAEAAKDKVSMCIGCHSIPGYKSSFPTVFPVPMIAGQSEAYLAAALKAYRKGDRTHPSMRGIAGSLTDQDIADLAAYFAKAE